MPRPTTFSSYLAAVIIGGVAIAVAAFVMEGPANLLGPRPELFVTFASLLLLAESRPVMWLRRKQGAVITAAPSFNSALLFLVPGLGAAVAAGILSAIGDMTCGRPPIKTAFNAAMMTITVSVPSMLLYATGDRLTLIDGSPVTAWWIVVVAVALVAHNIVNDALVAVVVALSERLPVKEALRRDVLQNAQFDGVLLALGPVMVVVAVRSILLLPVLLVVTILVLNTTRMALERLHQATHDPLTGLPNRRLFDQQLSALMQGGSRKKPVTVMIVDLDRFKAVNDTLGHEIGDRVLKVVAKRLQEAVPVSGMVARLGGDEFAVVLADSPPRDRLESVGLQLHAAFTGSLHSEGMPLSIWGSVGVAQQLDERSVSQLMRRADLAMYLAKHAGGGVRVHEPDGKAVGGGRLSLLDELGPAIRDNQLFLHYQPMIQTETGQVTAVEALVRWQHPEHGLVMPDQFIPTAEQTDLIDPLTTWVLERAMADCRALRELGEDVAVAVNLSSRSVTDLTFPRHLRSLVTASGLSPERLILELTENTILSDTQQAMEVLAEIRALGVRLALDDFGTGFSSLSNLRDLPLDAVKIDRSFVTHMLTRPEDAAIVSTVLALADRLGVETVGEGVEDEEVMAALKELGCTKAQGYHIAKPMPFDQMADWLRDQRAGTTPLRVVRPA